MIWNVKTLKRVAHATLLASSLVLGLAVTANAQDPYWNQRDSGKRHQKQEKRELKRHQRLEREEFGNSAALRRHQKEERDALKRHQKRERRSRDRWWMP